MLGNLALYVANRAAGDAVGSLTRWAVWGGIAAVLAICGLVFGAVALYAYLVPLYGSVLAASAIAAGGFVLALFCFAMPFLLDYADRKAADRKLKEEGRVASTVQSVQQETEAAVDYFGPLQVLASAFVLGLKTGSSVKQRMR